MSKLFRPLGRKLCFFLSIVLVCIAFAVGSAFAQSASLTATVSINPLEVQVSAPPSVLVGQWFDIKAEVSNIGTETVIRTSALINTPSELKVRGRRKYIGNLVPGATETLIWQARVNQAGSNLIIQVEASGRLAGEEISASDSTIISASGSLGAFLFSIPLSELVQKLLSQT